MPLSPEMEFAFTGGGGGGGTVGPSNPQAGQMYGMQMLDRGVRHLAWILVPILTLLLSQSLL
jgi:hypothetical protein